MLSSRKLNFPLYLFASFVLLIASLPNAPERVSSRITLPVSQSAAPAQESLSTFSLRDGLAGNFVTALAAAPDGTVWVGTTTGTTRIGPARWTTFTHLHGLGDDWITAIAIAPDGRVWFGTQSGGVSVFDGGKFTTYDITNSAIPSNLVTSIAVDSNGAVWVGTLDAGVAMYAPATNRWTRYRLANNSVKALAINPDGSLWAGTDGGGAFRFDGTKWVRADLPGSGQVKMIETIPDEGLVFTTPDGRFHFDGKSWTKVTGSTLLDQTARALSLQTDQIAGFVGDGRGHNYFATPDGLVVGTAGQAETLKPLKPLPVVLVHGWTVSPSDDIQESEFRFLQQYANDDGIPVFYAAGVSPENNLFENAARLRDDIAAVKQETGASRVNLIAFSMGGLNARAYLESALYQGDVNRVIILGTPQSGVDIWKPILAEQIIQKPDEPSAIELTPEYAKIFNQSHAPPAGVPYDLLIGDARNQPQLGFISDLPPNDGLISVASALSLNGENVRQTVDEDLHAFDPMSIPFYLTSYLYPRDTYDRYLRNALRDPTNAPIGSEVRLSPEPNPVSVTGQASTAVQTGVGNHTKVFTAPLAPGETVTRTVTLDTSSRARFLAYFPGGDLDLTLHGPDHKIYDSAVGSTPGQASETSSGGVIKLKADIASFVGYTVTDPAPGVWLLILTRTDKGPAPLDVTTYVDLNARQALNVGVNRDILDPGEPVTITATLTIPVPEAAISARIASPGPNPGDPFTFAELPMPDEGNGIYAATFTPPRGGYYVVIVDASGADLDRARELLFAANPAGSKFVPPANVQVDRDSAGRITGLAFGLDIEAQRPGVFAVGATLHRPDGQVVARIATPVILAAGDNHANVVFHGDDLTAPGPYLLDLTLLDTSWAAIPVDGEENAATVQP